MQYEKYTFWLLLFFAASVSAAAYWAHKKVSDMESTLTDRLKQVEVLSELVMVNLPDIKKAATTLGNYSTAISDAGLANPSAMVDWIMKTFGPKPPVLQSTQPKVTTTSTTATYRIGRA